MGLDFGMFGAARGARGELTDEEQRLLRRANMWAMDWEADGGTLPPEVVVPHDRRLTHDEARALIAWFKRTAPGSY